MGRGKTFTVLAAALYAKIVSNELVSNKEYKLPFLLGRTLHLWREEVEQGFPGLSLVHRGWYPCTHAWPLPRCLFQLLDNDKPTDIAPWHPVLSVVLHSVRETFVAATKTITAGTVRLGRLLRTLCGQYKILRGSSSRRELNLGLG